MSQGEEGGEGEQRAKVQESIHGRGRRHARRAGGDPRRRARAPATSMDKGTEQDHQLRRIKLHRHPLAWAPSRCGTSAARIKRGAASRQISMGSYDRPRPAGRSSRSPTTSRYRSWKTEPRAAVANAVIIYMMDVSGSMGDEQKEIVRIESFWIDTWLQLAIQRPREPLHHPRRRWRKRGRPRHVLPHARVGRHDDQLERLQAVLASSIDDHYPPELNGTSIRSTSRTATTGRSTTPTPASSCSSTRSCRP